MWGVDLAGQFCKYYSVGRSSKKWYKYLFWFAIDVSICNAFILQNHFLTGAGRFKLRQANFSKQLIAGFSCTASAAQSSMRQKIENLSLGKGNADKHFCKKIKGRKRQCVRCKRMGIKTPSGQAVETSFQCVQ